VALSPHRRASSGHATTPVVRIVDPRHTAHLCWRSLLPESRTAVDTPVLDVSAPAADEALVEESLVEEVSIDGMCGVY
jgi:mycofactocin precursor